MGSVCGCGDDNSVDFKEKERIKALASTSETKNVIHQIDAVKHQFKNVNGKNVSSYFDAFYDIISPKSKSSQEKFNTILLLSSALENNVSAVQVFKKHPLYLLLCKEINSNKSQHGIPDYVKNKLYSWQDRYELALLELIENTSNKFPNQLTEFQRFYEANREKFPRASSFLSMNAGFLEKENDRLGVSSRNLEELRKKSVEEIMKKAQLKEAINQPGGKTQSYFSSAEKIHVKEEDVNLLDIMGLTAKLNAIQNEVDFANSIKSKMEIHKNSNFGVFEKDMRKLIEETYPNMINIIDQHSVLSEHQNKPKNVVFHEDDLDVEIGENGYKNNGRKKQNDLSLNEESDEYEYDIDENGHRSRSRSKSKSQNNEKMHLNDNFNDKNRMKSRKETQKIEKEKIVQQNAELKKSIGQLAKEKEKLYSRLKKQTTILKQNSQVDQLNLTSMSQFNLKSFSMNSSHVDLLRILNEKESQLEKLQKNYTKLEQTFNELYNENEIEKTIKSTNVDTEPRMYASMLLLKETNGKHHFGNTSRLDSSRFKQNSAKGNEFVDDLHDSIQRVLDGKKESQFNY